MVTVGLDEETLNCNICSGKVTVLQESKEKDWVTSDGYIMSGEVQLCLCSQCGHVQKNANKEYLETIADVYKNYRVNSLDGSIDQISFLDNGIRIYRSSRLIKEIVKTKILKNKGSVLDVGCGTGQFLKAWHDEYPQWDMYGQEYDTHFKERILAIPGVKGFYLKEDCHGGKFSCISMSHVLEHVLSPTELLLQHNSMLENDGIHLVQVPCFLYDPFDLCIYDHVSHFTSNSLEYLSQKGGVRIVDNATGWVPKHIGWLAQKGTETKAVVAEGYVETIKEQVEKINIWLEKLPHLILEFSKDKQLGIFGSNPAAVWVAKKIDNKNDFFVDEDVHRMNHIIADTITLLPADCPEKLCVFLPFVLSHGKQLKQRLQKQYPHIEFFGFEMDLLSDMSQIKAY